MSREQTQSEHEAEVEVLLDRADGAVQRAAWADVSALAEDILLLEAENAEALGLQAQARRRLRGALTAPDQRFDGERRTVTVAFSDLSNSTQLAERVDPEEMRELLSWYHRMVGEAVTAAGGYVARFMGDGALIYFGYPNSTEEAPRQAVSSGLQIVSSVRARRADVHKTYGVEIDARVGIHTGLAVIAEMGGGNRTEADDIVGETPNIAARLEGFASPGTVVISAATGRLVDGYFDLMPRGPQMLKGISRPIEALQVIAATGASSRLEASGSSDQTPLMGREAERKQLARLWEQACTGSGGVVLLSGEAGVGKSRLVASQLQDSRAVLRTSCAPHSQSTPFHPLRHIVTSDGGRHSLMPDEEAVTAGESVEARRNALLSRAVSELQRLTANGPTMFIIEDIHWADPSTLEFLGRLAAHTGESSLLVAATLRPEIRIDWSDGAAVTELELAPLQQEDVAAMVTHLLGPSAADHKDVGAWLIEHTGGVPLYLEELVRSLQESGKLDLLTQSLGTAHPEIPLTLQGILLGRLDRLGVAKRVAQMASVIGRDFEISILRDVAKLPNERFERDLADLLKSGLVEHTEDVNLLRFRHALIRDAAYASILRSTSRQVHGDVADLLPLHDPEILDHRPEVVAVHLAEAERFGEAAAVFESAARRAVERYGHSEAISHLRSALRSLARSADHPSPVELELRLRLLLGPSLISAQGYGSEDVVENYERARELCADAEDSQGLFDSVRGLAAYFLLTAEFESASSTAESALGIASRSAFPSDLLEASAWLGTVRFFEGRLGEASALLDHAIARQEIGERHEHATRYGLDPGILALSHRVWLHWLMGEVSEAFALKDSMVETAERLNHPLSYAHALNYATGLAVFVGEYEDAVALADVQIELARRSVLPHYEAYGEIFRGRATAHDDPAAAAVAIRAGLDLRKTTGALLALPLHHALLAEVHIEAGDLSTATIVAGAGLEIARTTGEQWWTPELLRLMGEVTAASGASGFRPLLEASHQGAKAAGADLLMVRTALSALKLDPDLQREDQLHPAQHQQLINAATPETRAMNHVLGDQKPNNPAT